MNKRFILAITAVISFLVPFMGSALNVALPALGSEFGMNALTLVWVATSYLLATAVCLVPVGSIADMLGRERVFVAGVAGFSLSSLLSVFSSSSEFLLFTRVLQGISGSMTLATALPLLVAAFPAHERGKVLGINVTAVYTGLSAGPFLGGMLTHYFGWRSIFIITATVGGALWVPATLLFRKGTNEVHREKLDSAGMVIYAASMIALNYGLSRLPSLSGILLACSGTAGFIIFWYWEKRDSHPLVHVDLLTKNRVFAFSLLAALVNYSATFAVGFLMSLYLHYVKGLEAKSVGFILVSQPLMQAILSPLAGKLSDTVEPRVVASAGMLLTSAGLFLLLFLSAGTPLWYSVCCLLLLGFGFALFSSPNTNAVMSSVEARHYGIASGMLATMRLMGQMLSMAIALLVFALLLGNTSLSPAVASAYLSSMKFIIAILVILSLAGILASLVRGRVRG